MAVGESALQTWDCRSCGVRNVQHRTHCSNCHAAGHRCTTTRHIQAMDLEEFCAQQSAKGARLQAAIERVGVELYLTLTPPTTDPPRVFLIANENGVAPCDNFGRPSW
jgi:hypothetical protein